MGSKPVLRGKKNGTAH